MRVLILAVNFFQKPYPVYPLGAAAAAEAARRAGHEVRLADLLSEGGFEGLQPGRLERLVKEFRPEAVGLSLRNLESLTGDVDEGWSLAGLARLTADLRRFWSGPVFLGGAGFSLLPEQALAWSGADYGLPGEAEEALPAFLERLAAGRAVPGLQARPGPAAAIGLAAFDPDLVRDYAGRGGLIGVQTRRGCAFNCLYCSYLVLEGHTLRFRPTAEVMADLAQLAEILAAGEGVPFIAFADAVFNDPAGHWRDILAALAEARLPLRWTAFFQPTAWAPGDLELIRRSGAAGLEFGTDAASDSALAGLNKPFDFETVRRVQAECAAAGLPAAHYVVFGGPGETEATVAEGLDNLERLENCVVFVSAGWSVYPRTPLFDLARAEGQVALGDLPKPAYYFAPGLDPAWLRARLDRALKDRRDRFFPPDRVWAASATLRRMGWTGLLWDNLIGAGRRGSRRVRV